VGAGPYGLAVASHLRAHGIDFRIFGRPMQSWRAHMPSGMQLKSEGFATNLSDPSDSFTLKRFCRDQGLPYEDAGTAVPLSSFLAYGLAFQKRFVPDVEERTGLSIKKSAQGFELVFEDGETLTARRLVLAVGLHPFREVPAELGRLPGELVSHSADHADLEEFRCRDVTVLGGGSSAVELATLLHERGAKVRLVTRRAVLQYQSRPAARPLWRRVLRPLSGIGYGWHSLLIAEMPALFHLLLQSLRLRGVSHYLMPAPGWFVRDRFQGIVPHLSEYRLESARAVDGQAELRLRHMNGREISLRTDHVIAATGYRLDLDRLPMLDEGLRHDIRRTGTSPRLSANFESTIPGLYFLGPLSANCFGPAMRFVLGTRFTAAKLGRHLGAILRHPPLARPALPMLNSLPHQTADANADPRRAF
jgi:pyridine nucleotide-disulfide oxidoreductase